ncbi:alpha-1,6-mannosyl-glycoprotein 4-beta-N-acetylglucosaminyltransferase-like [Tachyglossus aculeatus]|uniref:alpha-1,6-mannosyl-glycoprotein 4-beta-N-acetylglucosaminyltransferase-like n=1 Tax=Tachyglossus aculeatus TaxID=9261 RepID=UPI0018F7524D|nr:alpha-1,6-mannosyl-glycoprotein 4-beta-N-acetylglucosaminyltransferase-like [Tachyglossus aculeatus]
MRCSLRRSVWAVMAFALLGFFLRMFTEENEDPLLEEKKHLAWLLVQRQLNANGHLTPFQELSNNSALLNLSFHYLAGAPPPVKKLLTVGLSSVRRPRGSYLLDTLGSVFQSSSAAELRDALVVVHLADPDPRWARRTAAAVAGRFASQLLAGQLLLVRAPPAAYPPLRGLKRNFGDAADRVAFRSKQNVDYAFLVSCAANLSRYFLMIEDDVRCARGFLTAVRRAIEAHRDTPWVTLEFSKLGYIGKLYRASDLPRLARFLLLFYQEMPCDWLLDHFRLLLAQKDPIRLSPSLFQHVGTYSSFRGTINELKDDEYHDGGGVAANPLATFHTDMTAYDGFAPERAYAPGDGFFWGHPVLAGSHLTVVFLRPARVRRLRVATGTAQEKKDRLRAGRVELGRRLDGEGRDCSDYRPLGPLLDGQLAWEEPASGGGREVRCVRLVALREQRDWLIVRHLDVWTEDAER